MPQLLAGSRIVRRDHLVADRDELRQSLAIFDQQRRGPARVDISAGAPALLAGVLVEANDEFFSVFVKDQKLNYSHPLKTILTIIEGQDGVEAGTAEQKAKFKAVVKVYPLVLF